MQAGLQRALCMLKRKSRVVMLYTAHVQVPATGMAAVLSR